MEAAPAEAGVAEAGVAARWSRRRGRRLLGVRRCRDDERRKGQKDEDAAQGNAHPKPRTARISSGHVRPVRRPGLRSCASVIVSLHVATGAAAGALAGSRLGALGLGFLLHAAGDRMPHHDVGSRRFEIVSGTAALLFLAVARGPLHPAVVGGIAASVPDVEHVLPLPRPDGRKLFPSHRFHGWHRAGGVPAWAQLLAAGAILGALARPGPSRAG